MRGRPVLKRRIAMVGVVEAYDMLCYWTVDCMREYSRYLFFKMN
jgi:hypothetical protein